MKTAERYLDLMRLILHSLFLCRLKLKFSCMMELSKFPLDEQVCTMEIASCESQFSLWIAEGEAHLSQGNITRRTACLYENVCVREGKQDRLIRPLSSRCRTPDVRTIPACLGVNIQEIAEKYEDGEIWRRLSYFPFNYQSRSMKRGKSLIITSL